MDRIHHVAITVEDIDSALAWYSDRFHFLVEWKDDSWALLRFDNIALALVLPDQHPPHVAFETDDVSAFGTPTPHRDGTASVYVRDNHNNVVEYLSVPES